MSIGVVWNRSARRARHLAIHQLFPEAEVCATQCRAEAIEKAAELGARHETVVAVGGDGTVNAVINGLRDCQASLGIVPAGTGNVLAHELRIPIDDLREAARICLGNASTRVDLGVLGSIRFAASVGFGVDGAVVARADPWKPILGRSAFVLAAFLEQLCRHRFEVAVQSEGATLFQGHSVLVAAVNSPRYAGWRMPSPGASVRDGLLDLFVVRPARFPGTPLVDVAALALIGKTGWSRRVMTFRRKSFELSFVGHFPRCQMDGELLNVTETSLAILPQELRVKTREVLI